MRKHRPETTLTRLLATRNADAAQLAPSRASAPTDIFVDIAARRRIKFLNPRTHACPA
jgi:hypothetical protein